MPQNTGAEPFSNPDKFDRHAAFGRYWPSGIVGTDVNAANWKSASNL